MLPKMNKKFPIICLLGASFSANNMGVNALASGTLKSFFKRYPDGNLFLVDYCKKKKIHDVKIGNAIVPVELINIRFSKKFYLKNNIAMLLALSIVSRCVPFRKIKKFVITDNSWLSRIAEADIVGSIAGGDSFSDIYGFGRFIYVVLPQLLALSLGKKLVLLPQTIGPFKGAVSKIIAKSIINRAEVVYSRDRIGIRETMELIGSKGNVNKIKFCYDVGFVVDPVKQLRMDTQGLPIRGINNHPVVGFNVSGLLFMGGYTQNNMFNLRINYRQLVKDIIDYFIRKKGNAILLVPHVFGMEESKECDARACEIIYDELKQKYKKLLYIVRGNYDLGEIKYIIGQCNFFVGSRMHACIAALSQNIPAVSIAYSKKFYGVMHSIGFESLVADPRKLDNEEIVKIIDEAYERCSELQEQLKVTIPKVKKTVLEIFNEICIES